MTRRRCAPWLAAGLLVAAGCTGRTTEPVPPPSDPPPADIAADPADRYDQPFVKAVTDEVGPDQLPPVDHTLAGKSSAALREAVERVWPTIKLTGPDNQPLRWVVNLETDEGDIEISLRPDLAPNHCRNLIALVKVGYYDGLRFDRLVHQEAEAQDGTRSELRMVRFGCPAGTGDPGVGHLGYRLRSEFSDEKHAAGTVGFSRDLRDPSSAGVRLYVTLAPAPVLDGNFTVVGKVSKGLDVVEAISRGRLLPPDVDETRELPELPVVIRRATAAVKP